MFSDDINYLCSEILKILQWMRDADRKNLPKFPLIMDNLKNKMKELYKAGREELQPGRLDALLAMEMDVNSGSHLDGRNLANQLLSLVTKCFKDEWEEPLLITLNVTVCRHHLSRIKGGINKSDAVEMCQKILKTVFRIIGYFQNRVEESDSAKASAVILCLNQIKTILPLFLAAIGKECTLLQNYAANCLQECLEKIQKESCEKTSLACSEFIDVMDAALFDLDQLTENTEAWMGGDGEEMKSLKTLIDEVLCHAMSAAQVATSDDDKQTIHGKAQTILRGMESLKDELAGEDISSIHLSAAIVGDALCALERAVNSTVLRLVLHISSCESDPLRDLVAMCQFPPACAANTNSHRGSSRKASDLDDTIMEFDSHMDRLIQIGTFAVSCSSNVKKAVQIRSCLASFESLEAELVPCATALYLDPSRENKLALRMFINHWLQESSTFRSILDTIVDPAAYIDVLKDYLKDCLNLLKVMNKNGEKNTGPIIRKMTKAAGTLDGVIKASIQQDCPKNVEEITKFAQQVSKAMESCERLRALQYGSLPADEAVKRASTLEQAVQRLWEILIRQYALTDASYNNDTICDSELKKMTPKTRLPPNEYYTICPADVGIYSGLDLLTPHIASSKLQLKKAVLYDTPKRQIKRTPIMRSTVKKCKAASAARSRCFRSEGPKSRPEMNELSDMELTALLSDITHLDSTFALDHTIQPKKNIEFQGRRLLDLFSSWENLSEGIPDLLENQNGTQESTVSAPPGSTIGSNDVETPERERDLLILEEKIEKLKMIQ